MTVASVLIAFGVAIIFAIVVGYAILTELRRRDEGEDRRRNWDGGTGPDDDGGDGGGCGGGD